MMHRFRLVAAAIAAILFSAIAIMSIPATASAAPPVLSTKADPSLTWSKLVKIGAGNARNISCPTTTFCAVSSYSFPPAKASTTTTGGVTIAVVTAHEVSCVSATFCMEVTPDGLSRTWNGKSWGAKKRFAKKGNPFVRPEVGVSCASKSFCVATDTYLNVAIWRGSSWKKSTRPKVPEALSGQNGFDVSCTSKRHCLILAINAEVPGAVYISAWNGARWAAWRKILPAGTLRGASVSCAGTGAFCLAVGNSRYTTQRKGNWSAARPVKGFNSSSCVTSTFCVGVRGKQVSTFNGSSWSALTTISSVDTKTGGLESVSCPSTSLCAASDSSGTIVLGRSG